MATNDQLVAARNAGVEYQKQADALKIQQLLAERSSPYIPFNRENNPSSYGNDTIEDDKSTDAYFYQISGEQSSTTTYNQNVRLEDGTLLLEETAGDNIIFEDEVGFSSVLLENSDSADSFFIISESYSIETIDTSSDNEYIGTEMVTVLDFTESNPFGDPTEGSF